MARIIHVDDRPEWIAVVRRALADHHVDSARSFEEALQLIHGTAPYDVALVDLNLVGEDDRMGNELLDLLMTEFPTTRRVVVTASVPVGALRAGVFERYDLDDVIIKGKATVPGLRMVVNRALKRGIYQTPQVRYYESELTERYRDWHDRVTEELRSRIRDAEYRARDAGRFDTHSVTFAAAKLSSWLALRGRFHSACADLELIISAAMTIDDVRSTAQQLELVMNEIAGEMSALQPL
jgi:CheY-like chemotaxis protein